MENQTTSLEKNVQPKMPSVKPVAKLDTSTRFARARKESPREPTLFRAPRMIMTPTLTTRQPNPSRVNMLKTVNPIKANRGKLNEGEHLKFPIASHPRGPYNTTL